MKQLLYTAIFLFTAFSFSQNTGLIVGKILDNELNNSPLVLANVSIKGTATQVNTDITGLFVIENLEAGDYTLVCSFAGYETKEMNVHVDALNPTEVNLSLAASTISLSELALITSVAQKDDKSLPVLN
ncbi:carboxypeptidase-like regulatory domain-containing protein [Mariniflexile jejuense]|uniref:Carboxypeptidase-like regulatory domain-containing protein n=1 Tax=Mariniflexile jejuense TaxID=1173582 RepID=A0ABW3JJI7_9FLAO